MISVHFQGRPFNITVIQAYTPTVMLKKRKLNSSRKKYKPSGTNTQKNVQYFSKDKRGKAVLTSTAFCFIQLSQRFINNILQNKNEKV